MLKPLRNKAFRWCWVGFAVSELGTRIHYLAIPVLAYNLTGTAVGVGACFMTISISMAGVGPFAGVLIDRLNRRRMLICASFLSALATALIPVAKVFFVVLLLELVLNSMLTFYYPVFNVVLPDIVDRDQLAAANALMALSTRTAQLLGPALGALCIAQWGVPAVFLLDAATFVAVVLCVAASRIPGASASISSGRFTALLRQGVRRIFTAEPLRSLVLIVGVPLGAALGVSNALAYVFSREVLGVGTNGYASLVSGLAAGLLAGSLLSPGLCRRLGQTGVLSLGLLALAVGFFAFAASRSIAPALAGRIIVGAGYALYSVSSLTLVQQLTPSTERGVVITSWRSVENISTTAFLAASGVLADLVGVAWIILSPAALSLAAGAGALRVRQAAKGGVRNGTL